MVFGLAVVLIVCWLAFNLLAGRDTGSGNRDEARRGSTQGSTQKPAEGPNAPGAPGSGGQPETRKDQGTETPGSQSREETSGPRTQENPSDGVPVSRGNGGRPPAQAGESPKKSYESLDPLGIKKEQVDQGVKNGSRLAATNFITYAYGYTGDDKEKYLIAVKKAVLDPEFFRSPGGKTIQQTADLIDRRGGIRNGSQLESFRVVKVDSDGDGLVGVARFSVGSGWTPPKEWKTGEPTLAGPVVKYEQQLSLIPWGTGADAWKLSAAGTLREVS